MGDTVKIRRLQLAGGDDTPSGRVARDERGNAVWQWSARDQELDPTDLALPPLSIAEEPSLPVGNVRLNKVGARAGYDPYESGLLQKKGAPRKRDLRQLSRWIVQQRARGQDGDDT